jgi:hypothetical protein
LVLVTVLVASGPDSPRPRVKKFLGSDTSTHDGHFEIIYSLPTRRADNVSILFVQAECGPALLTSAIGLSTVSPTTVIANERTTEATGNAFAQFVDDWQIGGNTYGMLNAVRMAANFANPETGAVGVVLDSSPNGTETSRRHSIRAATRSRVA